MRFLERTQALDALRAAWDDVAAGTGSVVVLSLGGASGLFIRLPDDPPQPPRKRCAPPATNRTVPGLTSRQQDVLDLLCAGLTNAEIAEYLVLSVRTVDHHVSAILRRLGVSNRRAARAKVLNQPPPRENSTQPGQTGNPTGPRAGLPHHDSHPSRRMRSA